MKNIALLLSLVFCQLTISVNAQKLVGIATYKTDRKVDLKMDSTSVDTGRQATIQAQLRKQFQKEFTLHFNAEESLYTEVEKLDTPSAPSSSGFVIKLSGNSDVLYRNTKELQKVNQTEIMDKPFLIKDVAEKPTWELVKEIRNIGNYTCFKATWTRDVDTETFDSLTDELVSKSISKTTTAWYTLDVPVQHGPSEFWGLPGLILEIEDGDLTILCSKVVMNPARQTAIEVPSKGKEVTQLEYDLIQKKKNAEMMEQFHSSNGRKGDGHQMTIKIGG